MSAVKTALQIFNCQRIETMLHTEPHVTKATPIASPNCVNSVAKEKRKLSRTPKIL